MHAAPKAFDHITIQLEGDSFSIPKRALHLAFDMLGQMGYQKSITVLPADTAVGPRQAAAILQVSGPRLTQLLDEGAIPFKKVGARRKVLVQEVVDYEQQRKERRLEILAVLANQAPDLEGK